MRAKVAILIALLVLAFPAYLEADPLRFPNGAKCTTEAGSSADLSPGTVTLAPAEWQKLDTEIMRLQDAETRLAAQNAALKSSSLGVGGIIAVASALLSGVALGYYIAR